MLLSGSIRYSNYNGAFEKFDKPFDEVTIFLLFLYELMLLSSSIKTMITVGTW